jgi:hypothetical protein
VTCNGSIARGRIASAPRGARWSPCGPPARITSSKGGPVRYSGQGRSSTSVLVVVIAAVVVAIALYFLLFQPR